MAGSYYNSILRINNQTGTSYTLSIADFNSDTITIMDNASANTVTVPPSVFPIGAQLLVAQEGLGQTSFVAGAGVTINAIGLSISSRYKSVALIQVALNEWDAYGTLDASLYTARTTAFATATAITDTTILNALNTFDLGLISNGLDTKMKAIYPFVGTTSTTQKFNFMDARDLDVAFRLSFGGGGTFSSDGYLPNGTNAFADTFFRPSVNSVIDNISYNYYSRTNTFGNSNFGSSDSGYAYLTNMYISANGSQNYAKLNGMGYLITSSTDSRGLFGSNTTTNGTFTTWKNGNKLGTNTSTATGLSPSKIWIGGGNFAGSPEYGNMQCAFFNISTGLTDAQQTTLYNLVQAMQTSLARNV